MIPFVFICILLVSSVTSQSCPSNSVYGPFCNISCSNCYFGCDVSGSCTNSTCKSDYYGNTCKIGKPRLQSPILTMPNSPQSPNFLCNGIISVASYQPSSDINPIDYKLLFGTDASLLNINLEMNNSVSTIMTHNSITNTYTAPVSFTLTNLYYFGVFFTFETPNYYGTFNSSISFVDYTIFMTNCSSRFNSSFVPTTVPPITMTPSRPNPTISPGTETLKSTTTMTLLTASSTTQILTSTTTIIPSNTNTGTPSQTISSTATTTGITQSLPTTLEQTTVTKSFPTTQLSPKNTLNYSNVDTNFIIRDLRLQADYNFIIATWISPLNPNGLTGYNVAINSSGRQFGPLPTGTLTYNITDLLESTPYLVTVTALYGASSFPSTGVAITTLSRGSVSWNKFTQMLSWTVTVNTSLSGFRVYVNDSLKVTLSPSTFAFNLSNYLLLGTFYKFTVGSLYGSVSEINSTTTGWTLPMPFVVPLNPPVISKADSTSAAVQFPSYSGYNGLINVYYMAVRPTSPTSSSRRKRDINCNPGISQIPNNANFIYANDNNANNQTIVVGSGDKYPPLNCNNPTLQPSTNYTIYAIIGSLVDSNSQYAISNTTFVTAAASGPNVGMILGIIIGILLLILIIILLLFYFLRWRKTPAQKYGFKGPYEDIKPKSHLFWSNIMDKMQPRRIVLDYKNIPVGFNFKDEYDNLPKVPCIEHNGMELKDLSHIDQNTGESCIFHSSRYNLSFIDGYIRRKAYISIQNPYNSETIIDFWLMIFSENVGQIVKFSMEGEQSKNNFHWPEKSEVYGHISVTKTKEEKYAFFDVREFSLVNINSNENIRVNHYHYRSWPKNDQLVNPISFLDFHQIIKRSENKLFGPTVVYSLMGCSVNALYIGFDILNDQLYQENEVNVFRCIGQLRRFDQNMMININQYMMLYDFLFESYFGSRYVVDVNLKRLMNSKSSSFTRFLEAQSDYIQQFNFLTYRDTLIRGKNVYFDGVEYPQSIILTPAPSPFNEASVELWDSVFANDISIIVDFQNRNMDEMHYARENLYNYSVVVQTTTKYPRNVLKHTVQVMRTNINTSRTITIYSLNSNNQFSGNYDDCENMVELVYNIWSDSLFNLLVLSAQDSIMSTTFIVCLNAVTKLHRTNFVSVYYTVKSLQSTTFKIIQTDDQFKFIFELLEMWIDVKFPKESQDQSNFDTADNQYAVGPYGKSYSNGNKDSTLSPISSIKKTFPSKYQNNYMAEA